MTTVVASSGGSLPNTVNLSNAQTGNVVSTNVLDRGGRTATSTLLQIVTTIGATPTVTVDIQGSADGTAWWSIAYADSTTPETVSVAALVITTAATFRKILRQYHPWRYLRLNYSANTNVTLTADVWVF